MTPRVTRIIAPDALKPVNAGEMLEVEVTEVLDGDGFLARAWHPLREEWIDRVSFRFAFIDAPEMQQPHGVEAKEFLHSSIAGKRLELDLIGKQSTGYNPIDQYRRVLCTAYLTEQIEVGEVSYLSQGKLGIGAVRRARPVRRNIELEIVVNGWAWVANQYAFDREGEYFAAQEDARRHRRGIWCVNNPEPPWTFKHKEKRRRAAAERQSSLL